jgi:hypothetical protein
VPKDLIAEYSRIAKLGGNFRGLAVLQHADVIAELCRQYHPKTLLDYGSGAGDQYKIHKVHHRWGVKRIDIRCYDPAFKNTASRPDGKVFDAIICSDVLEHLREADAMEAIEWMVAHARKFVWLSVCCRPAKKLFDDGENMHVTVRPFEWWRSRIPRMSSEPETYVTETP